MRLWFIEILYSINQLSVFFSNFWNVFRNQNLFIFVKKCKSKKILQNLSTPGSSQKPRNVEVIERGASINHLNFTTRCFINWSCSCITALFNSYYPYNTRTAGQVSHILQSILYAVFTTFYNASKRNLCQDRQLQHFDK